MLGRSLLLLLLSPFLPTFLAGLLLLFCGSLLLLLLLPLLATFLAGLLLFCRSFLFPLLLAPLLTFLPSLLSAAFFGAVLALAFGLRKDQRCLRAAPGRIKRLARQRERAERRGCHQQADRGACQNP